MDKHRLSFATVNILSHNIAELIIDNDVEVSLEMVEEHDQLLCSIFNGRFGVLVNKINTYSYSFEATLSMGSMALMKAIAIVNYSAQGEQSTQKIIKTRITDNLNLKNYSGLELGWQQAVDWLNQELLDENDMITNKQSSPT